MSHLVWYRSASADDKHDDQEVDLDAIGAPGGASWAYVALSYGDLAWTWGVMDHWLTEDAHEIASGEAKTQTEAKVAVERWVSEHPGKGREALIEEVIPAHIHQTAGDCLMSIGYVHVLAVPGRIDSQRAACTKCPVGPFDFSSFESMWRWASNHDATHRGGGCEFVTEHSEDSRMGHHFVISPSVRPGNHDVRCDGRLIGVLHRFDGPGGTGWFAFTIDGGCIDLCETQGNALDALIGWWERAGNP